MNGPHQLANLSEEQNAPEQAADIQDAGELEAMRLKNAELLKE